MSMKKIQQFDQGLPEKNSVPKYMFHKKIKNQNVFLINIQDLKNIIKKNI